MLTHRIRLPDGTEIEFFASDDATFQEQFGNFGPFEQMQSFANFQRYQQAHRRKHRASKTTTQAKKRQRLARRKHR